MLRLDDLNIRIARLQVRARTPEDYLALQRLIWQRELLIAEQTVRQLKLAPQLLDAVLRSGTVEVVMPDRSRVRHTPYHPGDPMNYAYNIATDVLNLAWRATGERPPLSIMDFPPSARPQPDR